MDRVRRGKDVGVVLVVVVCLGGNAWAGEKTTTEPPGAVPEPITKLIALKYRNPEIVLNVLGALPVQFFPDAQTNRLLVIALPEQMKQVEELVRELDVPIERTAAQPELELKLYRLRHRKPGELLDCLVPMLSDRGKISADPGSRTLIIKDEPAIHTDLLMILRELDVALEDAAAGAIATAPELPPHRPVDDVAVYETPHTQTFTTEADSKSPKPTVKLKLRVCELNRRALNDRPGESAKAREKSLLAAVFEGRPLHATYECADADLCVAEMLEHGTLKILSEPTLHILSGCMATFISSMGDLDPPVVVEDDSAAEATTRFNGWGMDLRFVPTVMTPDRITLRLSAPFLQSDHEANKSMASEEDGQPELVSVELEKGQVYAASGKIRQTKPVADSQAGLGAVPVLGQLFRSKRATVQESEMILLVFPEIVDQRTDKIARQPSADPLQSWK